MQKELEALAAKNGDRLMVINIKYLNELKKFFNEYSQQNELNPFQKWITNKMYDFTIPDERIKSLILMAVHHPFYAKVEFIFNGKKKNIFSLVRSDFEVVESYLKRYLEAQGLLLIPAFNLPLKRLGAQSGLAVYGKNNITYVDGLGSNFSYLPFFSDLPCAQNTWGEAKLAETCQNCMLCVNACPTGAIRQDRFLIDNQRCLSFFNEVPDDFPEWLDEKMHHTAYDCLYCQKICPMNADQIDKIEDNISFNAEETNSIINGAEFKSLKKQTRQTLQHLGMDDWYKAVPRNLKILLSKRKTS